jgi:hypothetical protein
MGLLKKNEEKEAVEKDFGLVEPVLDDDPIVPHRKRRLFIACACILGKMRAASGIMLAAMAGFSLD